MVVIKILTSHSADGLETQINKYIQSGWNVNGGVSVGNSSHGQVFAQSMAKQST